MKKFYTILACAAIALGVNAQTVKFYNNDAEIANGSTAKFHDAPYDDAFGWYEFKPDIKLKASSKITVVVKAECTTGQNINLCFGGQCGEEAPTLTSQPCEMTPGEYYPLLYDLSSFDEFEEVISTEISVIDTSDDSVINHITVVYEPAGNSVSVIESDNAIKYIGGNLYFDVDKAAELSLYSVEGSKVISTVIEGNGSISTTTLAKGIYVYRLGQKTGKIFVK